MKQLSSQLETVAEYVCERCNPGETTATEQSPINKWLLADVSEAPALMLKHKSLLDDIHRGEGGGADGGGGKNYG